MASLPELRILFYADRDDFLPPPSAASTLKKYTSVWLQKALKDGLGGGLTVDIKVARVNSGAPLAELLVGRHEVWFFLASDDANTALQGEDLEALLAWMNAGHGVLITGDHAAKKEGLEGLGAALGKCIPRARHMRTWDGGPDNEDYMANSTDAGSDGAVAARDLETDEVPQRLLLPAQRRNTPHKIFRGKRDRILNKFPDHIHEGEVRASVSYPEPPDPRFPDILDEWLSFAPKLEVIAHGVNWQNGRTHPLMAVWEQGTGSTGPGRIVADSSFHHYVDANLEGIAKAGGEDWSRIQELYCNLAVYLAPFEVRKQFEENALKAALAGEGIMALAEGGFEALGAGVMRVLAGQLPGVLYHQVLDDLADAYALTPAARACGPELTVSLLGAHLQGRLEGAQAVAPANVAELAMRRYLEIKELPLAMLEQLQAPRGPMASALDSDAG